MTNSLTGGILGHDAIYDEHPDKELRSADWLLANDPDATQDAHDHIMLTAGHVPGSDNRILLLDLADFMDPALTITNRTLLEQEAMALYNVSALDFASASASFLAEMVKAYQPERLRALPDWERDAFSRICEGIQSAIGISRKIIEAG